MSSLNGSQSPSPIKFTSAEKRAVHNALERKRRDHIKDMFSQLKDSVPNLTGEKVSPKSSRAQILKKACDYIQLMRRKNSASTKELQHIGQQITRTKKQIAKLESVRNTNRYVAALPAGATHPGPPHPSAPEDGPSPAEEAPPSVPVQASFGPVAVSSQPVLLNQLSPRPAPPLGLMPFPHPVNSDNMQMLMNMQQQGLMPRGLVPLSMPLPNMASLHQLYMRQQHSLHPTEFPPSPSPSPSGPSPQGPFSSQLTPPPTVPQGPVQTSPSL